MNDDRHGTSGLDLIRDLCRGVASFRDRYRFYEAAADCATRNPDLANQFQQLADDQLTGSRQIDHA